MSVVGRLEIMRDMAFEDFEANFESSQLVIGGPDLANSHDGLNTVLSMNGTLVLIEPMIDSSVRNLFIAATAPARSLLTINACPN